METALSRVRAQANEIILGKHGQIDLCLTCLLARGHLLIEDLPGVGKTTLAQMLAKLLGLDFKRVQFTSDMLPADILGASIYNQAASKFEFQPGPIFAQLILADEVNRATPKTQGALLEAMEERQVTAEGETRPLPEPFFVIATQNPGYQIGTFALPESQLDRFLMRVQMGYPDANAEQELLKGEDRRKLLEVLKPAITPTAFLEQQQKVTEVHASDAIIAYVHALVRFTRETPMLNVGLSPRAGLALLRASRAWALLQERSNVLPDDVQAVFQAVVSHRFQAAAEYSAEPAHQLAETIIGAVAIP